MFRKTKKQVIACDLLSAYDHGLLYGGSRSAKTTIIIYKIIARAIQTPSRHLIVRFRFNHAKVSLWHDTIPKVFANFFPQIPYRQNKTDWFITVPCVTDKIPKKLRTTHTSQIWLGGVDDKERTEKVLGNEYSTIHANEISQISYDTITTLRTRLAEPSGLPLKFFYDLNPCGKKHWAYQEFIKKRIPGTKEKSMLNCGSLLMNPHDNPYLPYQYITTLKTLPKRKRQRFYYGRFLSDVEGALWTDQNISNARTKKYGKIIKIVIAVDPAVTNNKDSDETGIIVCGLDENREGVVLEDYSIKASTATWAQRVVNAYNNYGANRVVAEVNQGGDLVKDVLKNIDRSIKVDTVHASKGKFARAEPISELYELGKIAHAKELPGLEEQLTEWVPMNSDGSPDRIDGLVWGMTHLMLKPTPKIHIG